MIEMNGKMNGCMDVGRENGCMGDFVDESLYGSLGTESGLSRGEGRRTI